MRNCCFQCSYKKLVIKERRFPRRYLGMYKTDFIIQRYKKQTWLFCLSRLRSINPVKSCVLCLSCRAQRVEGFEHWKRLSITKLHLPAVKSSHMGRVLLTVPHVPISARILKQISPLFNSYVFYLTNTSSKMGNAVCFICMSGNSTSTGIFGTLNDWS